MYTCVPSWDPKDPAVQEILSAGIFLPLPGFDRCFNFKMFAIQNPIFKCYIGNRYINIQYVSLTASAF